EILTLFVKEENSEETFYVYRIWNTVSEKYYFGISAKTDLFEDLRYNEHKNKHLQNSYNKYGQSAFQGMVMDKCDSVADAENHVNFYIEQYKYLGRTLYNY